MTYHFNRRRNAYVNQKGYDKNGKYHPILPTKKVSLPKEVQAIKDRLQRRFNAPK